MILKYAWNEMIGAGFRGKNNRPEIL